jgi:hypothetical protein
MMLVIMLNFVMLSDIMLSDIMLSDIMLIVVTMSMIRCKGLLRFSLGRGQLIQDEPTVA